MVHAVFDGLPCGDVSGDLDERGGDVACVGGRAELVGNDAERVAFASEPQHGFHEVVAVFAKHPCSAQDDGARAGGERGGFAVQLGLPVHALRGGGVGFAVGGFAFAVKHIVGGDVQKRGADVLGSFGEVARAVYVDGAGEIGLAFGFIYGGVGGGVDDDVGAVGLDSLKHGGAVGDV